MFKGLIFILPIICWSISLPVHFSISREVDPFYTYNVYQGHVRLSQNNWLLSVRPVITNENVGKQILGTEFNRFGLNGRITNAYIIYNSGKQLFCGEGHLSNGDKII